MSRLRRLFGLSWAARNAAATQQRTNWENMGLNAYAQEQWKWMSRLCDPDPEEIEFTGPSGETINLENPEIDFPFGVPPTPTPPPPDGGTGTTSESYVRWDRAIVPCRIGLLLGSTPMGDDDIANSEIGVQLYSVVLYPYGIEDAELLPDWEPSAVFGNDGLTVEDRALQLQIDVDEVIPENTWTLACRIAQTQVTFSQETVNGIPGPVRQSISTLSSANFIMQPIWV